MIRRVLWSALAALLAVALAGPVAHAQSTGAGGAASAAPGGGGADRQERRAAQLRSQLRIVAAQQPQWDAFVQVMRDNEQHMRQVLSEHAGNDGRSALDDMRGYAAITTAHAQDVQKLVPAFEALYAAMSPEQRKIADAVFHQYARRTAERMGAH